METIDAFILGALLGSLAGFFAGKFVEHSDRTLEYLRGFNDGTGLAIAFFRARTADSTKPSAPAGERNAADPAAGGPRSDTQAV